jgi:hypothetical protein
MLLPLRNWDRICADFASEPCTMLELMKRHGLPHARKRRVWRELQKRGLQELVIPPGTSKPGRAPRTVDASQVERLHALVKSAGSKRQAATLLNIPEATFRTYVGGLRALPTEVACRLDNLDSTGAAATEEDSRPALVAFIAHCGGASAAATKLGVTRRALYNYVHGLRPVPRALQKRIMV